MFKAKIRYLLGYFCNIIYKLQLAYKRDRTAKRYGFKNLDLGDVDVTGHVEIGEGTYIDSGRIVGGNQSKVVIGRDCMIGYNVYIASRTHPKGHPTDKSLPRHEADVKIGDRVWIGNNVVIREGITVGDEAIIGANSIVTHDVPAGAKVGGVPAKPLNEQ